MISILLVLTGQVAAVFDKSAAAHLALKGATVDVSVNQLIGKDRTRSKVTVSFIQPDSVRIRVSTPKEGLIDASDRSYTVVKGRLYGYDYMTNEYLVRDIVARGSLSNRLHSAIGQTNQAVSLLLDSADMKKFLGNMKTVPGWTISKNASVSTAKATMKTMGDYLLRFSSTNHRVLGARIATNESTIEWAYGYSAAPKSISFAKPRGAVKVEAFRERQAAPTFHDATARNLYEATVAAYRRRASVKYVVEDSSGKWAVTFSPSAVTQEIGPNKFNWKGGTLTVVQGGGRANINCAAKDLVHELSLKKMPLEPILRTLLQGFNPAERLFTGLKLKSSGSITVGGVALHVLEGTKSGYRLTVQLRGDNRLIAGTVSEQLDSRGRSLGRTERRFTYR